MHRIVSSNVQAVGYDQTTQTMRVAFISGGIYDYHHVAENLFHAMLQPHPWHRVGKRVTAHRYTRLI